MAILTKLNGQLRIGICFVVYAVLLFLASKLIITGLDGKSSSDSVVALTLFLLFLVASKKSFLVLLPLSVLFAFYAPIGFEYGAPSFQYVMSLLATDASEAGEFLSLIPLKHYLKALAIPLLLVASFLIARKGNLKPWRNKLLLVLSLIVFLVLINPIHFFSNLQSTFNEVQQEKQKLESFVTQNSWGTVEHITKKKDYVLVIGESVRRDYMHLYGYPIPNTPFMDKVPAIVVEGLSAAGSYTIGSLRLMLTLADKQWQPNYSLNVIDLAKSAGLETFWLSNQGYLSQDDTPISAIGKQADHPVFLNKSSYYSSRYSDFKLLELLNEQIKSSTSSDRLFVLHTLGSHPNACKRIENMSDPFEVTDKHLNYVACYVSSIKYTDQLLQDLYNNLMQQKENTGREFSILYFSDHGLAHKEDKGQVVINNNLLSKHHYSIPLVLIDSEFDSRKYLVSQKSGLLFTDGLATWLEISNDKLSGYNLFDGKNDSSSFGLKEKIEAIKYIDPAIDISNVLVSHE